MVRAERKCNISVANSRCPLQIHLVEHELSVCIMFQADNCNGLRVIEPKVIFEFVTLSDRKFMVTFQCMFLCIWSDARKLSVAYFKLIALTRLDFSYLCDLSDLKINQHPEIPMDNSYTMSQIDSCEIFGVIMQKYNLALVTSALESQGYDLNIKRHLKKPMRMLYKKSQIAGCNTS